MVRLKKPYAFCIFLLVILFYCSAYGQSISKIHIDSFENKFMNHINTINNTIDSQTKQITVLTDSLNNYSNIYDPIRHVQLTANIISILVALMAIIMGFITYEAKKHLDDSKKAIANANHALTIAQQRFDEIIKAADLRYKQASDKIYESIGTASITLNKVDLNIIDVNTQLNILNDKAKNIVTESSNYSEYFMIFLNNFLPQDKKLNSKLMRYVLDLASFDQKTRFIAIGSLKALGDKSVIPYLEWVIENRPSSKELALEAIAKITERMDNK